MSNATNPTGRLVCLLSLLLVSQSHVVLAQKPSGRWSRYLPPNERNRVYEKASFRSSENLLAADVYCLWITPLVAQSIISFSVEKEKINAEGAEQRYAWLRQDCHFVIIYIYGLDYRFIKSQAKIFLEIGDRGAGVNGAIVKAPFPIALLTNEGPRTPIYLMCFPRRAATGEAVIPTGAKQLRIIVQFPSGQAIIPISLKQLIKDGAEL